nr:hypothetical protein Iba_chr04fCG9360 [Ipomoea batatas]
MVDASRRTYSLSGRAAAAGSSLGHHPRHRQLAVELQRSISNSSIRLQFFPQSSRRLLSSPTPAVAGGFADQLLPSTRKREEERGSNHRRSPPSSPSTKGVHITSVGCKCHSYSSRNASQIHWRWTPLRSRLERTKLPFNFTADKR